MDEAGHAEDCATLQRRADACVAAGLLNPADAELVATATKQLDQQVHLAEGHELDLATGALVELSAARRRVTTLTRGKAAEFVELWDP